MALYTTVRFRKDVVNSFSPEAMGTLDVSSPISETSDFVVVTLIEPDCTKGLETFSRKWRSKLIKYLRHDTCLYESKEV